MGLVQELELLEEQRRAEIRTLHQTYLRTKRTVIRTASPTRIVRKHLGLSLLGAAALGMAMAPRPGTAATGEKGESRPKSRWGVGALLGRFKPMLQHVAPGVAEHLPDAPEPDARKGSEEPVSSTKPRTSHPFLHTLLTETATLLLAKVDFGAILQQVMQLVAGRRGGEARDVGEGGEHEPQVCVADAGTVKQQDYEPFE